MNSEFETYGEMDYSGEESYTNDQARIISVHDGEKNVPAILLTHELATKIQEALKSRRKLQKQEAVIVGEYQELLTKQTAIRRDQGILLGLEAAFRLEKQNILEDFARGFTPLEQIKADMRQVEAEATQIEQDIQKKVIAIGDAYKAQSAIQLEADWILEDAFIESGLLQPAVEEDEDDNDCDRSHDPERYEDESANGIIEDQLAPNAAVSEQNPNWNFPQDDDFPDDKSVFIPDLPQEVLDVLESIADDESVYIPDNGLPSEAQLHDMPEDDKRREAANAIIRARNAYEDAMVDLADREDTYESYIVGRERDILAGEEVCSQEDFDKMLFGLWQGLTQRVATNEKLWDEARQFAKDIGGVNWGVDEGFSIFAEREDDTLPEQEDDFKIEDVDKSFIERWLDQADLDEQPSYMPASVEIDFWNANLDKRWDTFTVLEDNPWKRRKIDHWSQDQSCQRLP